MKNFQIFNPQISPLLYSFTNIQFGGDFSEWRWFRFFGLKGARGERNSRTRIRLRLLFRSSRKQFPPRLIPWLIVTNETTKYRSKPINIFRDGEKERERRDRCPSFGFFVQRCRKSIEGMEMQRCSRAVCRAYVYISAFFLRSFLVVPFFLPGNTLILTPRIKEASRSAWLIGHNHASMPGIIADGREIPSPPIDEI